MQVGDLICVRYVVALTRLFLGDLPNMFSLVGHAYCDGIMDGEGLKVDIPFEMF